MAPYAWLQNYICHAEMRVIDDDRSVVEYAVLNFKERRRLVVVI